MKIRAFGVHVFGKRAKPNPLYNPKGRLREISAMVMMTVMYSARIARYDLQKAIQSLAKRIACWDPFCDGVLHWLMCYIYIYKTLDDCMTGCIGDLPGLFTPNTFADADFVGCPYFLRSTSGAHLNAQGPSSELPISSSSTGQSATAHSSTGAETGSVAPAMKFNCDPTITMWVLLVGQYHTPGYSGQGSVTIVTLESGMFDAIGRTGYPQKMVTLSPNPRGQPDLHSCLSVWKEPHNEGIGAYPWCILCTDHGQTRFSTL